jgi:hypothetical protein
MPPRAARSAITKSAFLTCTLVLALPPLLIPSGAPAAKELWKQSRQVVRSEPIPGNAADADRGASYRIAQTASNLTLTILADTKKNQDFVKADDQFGSFVYEVVTSGDIVKIQPASKEIMGVWKGNATLKEISFAAKAYFEDDSQFAPAFLVADVRNDGARGALVTGAYLDVSESATDFQPYLTIGDWGRLGCADGSYNPEFNIRNYGWGEVRNPRLIHSFGSKSTRSPDFVAALGTFDASTTATVEDGLRKSGLDIEKIKNGKFKCASKSQVPACLAKLKGTSVLGNLANYLYTGGNTVFTNVSGRIEYDWVNSDGKTTNRASPFVIDIALFHFDVGGGPECGAPGPVDRNDKPIELSLDRKSYRIPLDWRGQLASRQNSRFGFILAAAKSSRHVFKLVLELADGNTLTSPTMDLSYFKPRMPPPSPDDSEEKK